MKNDAAWESRIVFRLTQIGRTDTKFVFKTFSEVAGSGEAYFISNFGYSLVTFYQQLITTIEAGSAYQFDGRGTRDGFYLTVELHTAKIHGSSKVVHTQITIGQSSLNHIFESNDKERFLRRLFFG